MPDFDKNQPNPWGGPENPNPWGTPPQPQQPQPGWGAPPPGPNPAGGPPNPWGPSGPVQPRTPDTAIAALILGIAGLTMCPLICSVPAIILGKQAMNQVDAQPQAYAGRGIGLTGYVLGIIGTALVAVGVLIFILAVVFTA